MGLSPAMTLAGILILIGYVIITGIFDPEDMKQVSIQCSTVIAVLLAILRSDYLAAQNDKKRALEAEELKRTTERKAEELRLGQENKAEEVKREQARQAEATRNVVVVANQDVIKTLVEQTNGDGHLGQKIVEAKDEIINTVKSAKFNNHNDTKQTS